MSEHAEKVVCGDGRIRDVLSVLESVSDREPGTAAICDLCLTAADEIRRLRRKCNRLRTRANASEKAAAGAFLLAKTTLKCSIEHERELRKELEHGRE